MTSSNQATPISEIDFGRLVSDTHDGQLAGAGWGVFDVTCSCGISALLIRKIGAMSTFVCPNCETVYRHPGIMVLLEMNNVIFGEGSFLRPVGWQYADIITGS